MTRSEIKEKAKARLQRILQWHSEGKKAKEIAKLEGGISDVRVWQLLHKAKRVLSL